MQEREYGTVSTFSGSYALLTRDAEKDIFAHVSELKYSPIYRGDKVSYVVAADMTNPANGLRAMFAPLMTSSTTNATRHRPPRPCGKGRRRAVSHVIIPERYRLTVSRPTRFFRTSSAVAVAPFADGGGLICDRTSASSRRLGRV
jgi:cold shock CspA family protein